MPTATKERNGEPEIHTFGTPETMAAGDATPPTAQPLVLNDAYYELTGVNLRCLVKHLELVPENKLQTATTLCSEVDYVGVTKWHQRVTFYQSFDPGATYATLNAAYQAWVTSAQPAQFKARPHSSQVASATNPVISGLVIPMPFELLIGDAGDRRPGVGRRHRRHRRRPRLFHAARLRHAGEPGRADRRRHGLAGGELDGRPVRHHGRPYRRQLERHGLGRRRSPLNRPESPRRSRNERAGTNGPGTEHAKRRAGRRPRRTAADAGHRDPGIQRSTADPARHRHHGARRTRREFRRPGAESAVPNRGVSCAAARFPRPRPHVAVDALLRRRMSGRRGKPYEREVADARARFCHYWNLKPWEMDELTDSDFAAMLRLMTAEAREIERVKAATARAARR